MRKLLFVSLIIISEIAFAQAPRKLTSSEIFHKLNKVNVLGSVLYVAAHPDDENTRMIAYFANEELMQTAYLAATRGDGGQNLIGADIREKLGIIRTQELLAARRTDGGRQFFSRANDFGYSKHPDETFNIWDREDVLRDFVWVIRKFRPDIMITRFSEKPGVTHGHHTASAILAREAYKLAGDPNAFSDQLEYVDVWSPKKLYWNTSWWFYRRTGQQMDTTGLARIDVGKYNSLLGRSYTEIAASSRSMHKSQGFGATGTRGTEIEYLSQLEGADTDNPFDDINTGWGRIENGDRVGVHIENAIQGFDHNNPGVIVPDLLEALKEMENISDKHWKTIKTSEIKAVIRACLGLYLEAKADDFSYVPGDSATISFELVNRSELSVEVQDIYLNEIIGQNISLTKQLANNDKLVYEHSMVIPDQFDITNPYWLQKQGSLGMYVVNEQEQIGKPENDPAITASYQLKINGQEITFRSPVIYKRNDPVNGESYRPLEITPPVFSNIDSKVLIFGNGASKSVKVRVTAGKENVAGLLRLAAPEGWGVAPVSCEFEISNKGGEKEFEFTITPPKGQSVGELKSSIVYEGESYNYELARLTYDHIPIQGYYPESSAKVVKIDLKKEGQLIGYIPGAGDDIPASLRQIGYQVEILSKEDVESQKLARFDAVILGIRALNTVDWLSFKNQELFKYVENGGTMIAQYNTSHRLVTKEIAPLDLTLSRDRVAVEGAKITVLAPDHPVMNKPNKITDKDFDGWVQERGLYFPNKWDEKFTPILSSNDPGEDPRNGGLLVAQYGKGYYIYSGYSWFRELPAGVPGAYRIFTNLISIGK